MTVLVWTLLVRLELDTDPVNSQKIHQCKILWAVMACPRRSAPGRAGPARCCRGLRLHRHERDMPSGIPGLIKVLCKKIAGKVRFVPGQIQPDDMLALAKQGSQFFPGNLRPISPNSKNTDQVHWQIEFTTAVFGASEHGFDHTGGSKPWASAINQGLKRSSI